MKKGWYTLIILLAILTLAASLRFVNMNWDEGMDIHPDQRYLSQVANDIKWPENDTGYFNTAESPLNHANVGKAFFVYGTFPVYLTKFVADMTGRGNYGGYSLTGRFLSAFFDLMTIVVTFLIARQLFGKSTALISALLLGITVLHIQHSHFFVVDLFLTFFITLSFYFLLLLIKSRRISWAILLGISWGLALASKLSAILFAVIIFIGFVMFFVALLKSDSLDKKRHRKALLQCSIKSIGYGLLCILITFSVFRIAQPYAFQGPNIWNVKLSEPFVNSFEEQNRYNQESSASGFVPSFQWVNRPWYFQIANLTLWGLGIPLSIFCWLGLLLGIYLLIFKKDLRFLLLCAWPLLIIIWYAIQFVKNLRYDLPAIPFLIIFGAFFINEVYLYTKNISFTSKQTQKYFPIVITALLVLSCFFWTFAFTNIYLHRHPLAQASAWIYENVPENSTATVEPWDNGIPFHLQGMPPPPRLNLPTLQLFGDDTDEKIKILSEQLSTTDYIFITSGRSYMVLPRLERHPLIKRYYALLFNETLGFKLEQEFTNYPELFGIEINDDKAEESFSVYDHPKALIFKSEHKLNSDEIYHLIKGT